jgi:1-acyl-sn-glycerol-3-phosphate acyltransferase
MIGEFKRFDMQRKPRRQMRALTPVTWALSYPSKWARHTKVEKTGMAGIKPPYLLLCNHNSFLDFKLMTTAIFPHRANYVVAIDGFIKREWLLRAVGCIGNRKFVNSTQLVKNMLYARNNGDIVALYPEARYSLCGTQAVLPASLGKMVKLCGIPVVTLIMHGHHIHSPFWHPKARGASHLRAEMKLLYTAEQTQTLAVETINQGLQEAFIYDDYKWQRDNKIRTPKKSRAEGLHKVLYQCPSCKTEYRMNSARDELWCEACGKRWEMSELGDLTATNGFTEFPHIPDWYEWERENVRAEVARGEYGTSLRVRVDSLPNAKRFIDIGYGHLTHNMDGFTLRINYEGEEHIEVWRPRSLYSCHIEYDYKGRGDCVDLNTVSDTLYIYPEGRDFAVTKIALATEELYSKATREAEMAAV